MKFGGVRRFFACGSFFNMDGVPGDIHTVDIDPHLRHRELYKVGKHKFETAFAKPPF